VRGKQRCTVTRYLTRLPVEVKLGLFRAQNTVARN
jgi:hypothetical protein